MPEKQTHLACGHELTFCSLTLSKKERMRFNLVLKFSGTGGPGYAMRVYDTGSTTMYDGRMTGSDVTAGRRRVG
jgi:hypothetical protein